MEKEKRIGTYHATYQYGHPNVEEQNVGCFIVLYESGLIVRKGIIRSKELFRIPYEKIESVSTDIEKEWKGTRLAAGLIGGGFLLGPVGAAVGALLVGKKKKEHLGLVVRGQDREGNVVQIPIIFAPVQRSPKIKAKIEPKNSTDERNYHLNVSNLAHRYCGIQTKHASTLKQ